MGELTNDMLEVHKTKKRNVFRAYSADGPTGDMGLE